MYISLAIPRTRDYWNNRTRFCRVVLATLICTAAFEIQVLGPGCCRTNSRKCSIKMHQKMASYLYECPKTSVLKKFLARKMFDMVTDLMGMIPVFLPRMLLHAYELDVRTGDILKLVFRFLQSQRFVLFDLTTGHTLVQTENRPGSGTCSWLMWQTAAVRNGKIRRLRLAETQSHVQ